MHLYIITRGIKHLVDDFITQLQAKYLPFKCKIKDGKIDPAGEVTDMALRVSVRPIQLWEIVYPEGLNDQMLSTLLEGTQGKPQHKKHNKFVWALRRALGIKPVPKYKKVATLPLTKEAVEVTAIGVKPDYWIDKNNKHRWDATEEEKKDMFEGI